MMVKWNVCKCLAKDIWTFLFLIEQSCSNILLWNEGLYVTIFYPLDLLFDVFSIEDQGKVILTS